LTPATGTFAWLALGPRRAIRHGINPEDAMVPNFYFPIQGFEAVCTAGCVELQQDGQTQIWMTFFPSGVFTVREPGRGHAGRLPLRLQQVEVQARVAYALDSFVRRAA
jgi:hypothetical protein